VVHKTENDKRMFKRAQVVSACTGSIWSLRLCEPIAAPSVTIVKEVIGYFPAKTHYLGILFHHVHPPRTKDIVNNLMTILTRQC
jgi:hypothetical protein